MRKLAPLLSAFGLILALSPLASADMRVDAGPFTSWNVTVTPTDGDPQRVVVAFDSPLLKQRVTNLVWLPATYLRPNSAPLPVLYYLHGAPSGAAAAGSTDPYGLSAALD